jgi:hypothetical protein
LPPAAQVANSATAETEKEEDHRMIIKTNNVCKSDSSVAVLGIFTYVAEIQT